MENREMFQGEGNGRIGYNRQVADYLMWLWNNKWRVLLSIVVCVSAAGIYVYATPELYIRKAAVMIKTDTKGGSGIRELDSFKDFSLFNLGDVNVNNEIEAMASPILMAEVVRRLNLDVEYSDKGWLREKDLYRQSPVEAVFPEKIILREFSFRVKPVSDSVVSLYDFRANTRKMDVEAIETRLADTVETPGGKVVLFPSSRFADGFDDIIQVRRMDVMVTAGNYLKRLAVALAAKQTTVIRLSFTDCSVRRADDVLNTLIGAYNDEWVRYMNESAINTSKFIAERLDLIERELGMVDTDIERFKSENKLMDIQVEASLASQEASEYSGKAFELGSQLAIAGYIKEYLEDRSKTSALLPGNSGLNNQNIESRIGEYNAMILQRERLIANSSNKNPLIGDMDTSLDMMRQSILYSIDNWIATLQLQAKKIEEQEHQIAGQISSTPGKAKQLLSIERQQKIKESLYLYLLQKREENELSSSLVVNNTRLLTPASGNNVSVSPKKGLIFLLAFTFGGLFPFICWRVEDAIDATVRDRRDLSVLTLPFIGEIPWADNKKKGFFQKRREMRRIVVEEKNRDIVNEAFRVLRTNMDFMNARSGISEVILFTSFHSGSGKTFIAMNSAVGMAIKGRKVIVIDLDMRKASLSRYFHSPGVGISDYLSHRVDSLDKIITRGTIHPNLDGIVVGTIPPNPTELLLNGRFDRLIEELRSRYDYIYIDCTPLEIVADASIAGKMADVVVFVVRAGLMDRRMLPDVEKIYREKRFKNMGVVLNGTCWQGKYGYGY